MGFWDTVQAGLKSMANTMQETAMKVQALAEEYENRDDEWLKKKLKRSSDSAERMAAAKVLKARGYGQNSETNRRSSYGDSYDIDADMRKFDDEMKGIDDEFEARMRSLDD